MLQVRSFGTEGRKTTPPQIPASPDLYDFIIFRGVDIKELSVTEPSGPAPVPQVRFCLFTVCCGITFSLRLF